MRRLAFRIITIIVVSTCGVYSSSCPAKTDVGNCSCVFLKSKSESTGFSKQEILAGVAGILSPMLLGGSAFGIWKYIQFKKRGPQFDRAPSDLTDDSDTARDRKPFNKGNKKVTPSRERHDSDTDTYARPYSNPLSLSGESEYGFDDTPRDTPLGLSDMEQDANQGRWGSSPTYSSRPSQKFPTASSGGLNNWML